MSQVAERLMTAEEFFLMPEPDDGSRMELVCGRVITHMPAGLRHGRVGRRINRRFTPFIEEHGLGEIAGSDTGFVLQRWPDVVRAPDVGFIRAGREPKPDREEFFFEGAPDLAVEVVSPHDRAGEIARKVGEYLAAGTIRVWVVYPVQREVVVHYFNGASLRLNAEDTLTSDHAGFEVEGFELKVADIFA